MPKVPF